jgi:hypothetical protein
MLTSLHRPVGLRILATAMFSLVLLSSFSPRTRAETPSSEIAKPTLDNPRDVAHALRSCFTNVPVQERYHGMRITLRIGFNRKGEIIGQPLFTYITPDAPQRLRESYKEAMLASLARCTPLPFAPEIGDAFAGQPFLVRFIENR